jgi:hypothetical protein
VSVSLEWAEDDGKNDGNPVGRTLLVTSAPCDRPLPFLVVLLLCGRLATLLWILLAVFGGEEAQEESYKG